MNEIILNKSNGLSVVNPMITENLFTRFTEDIDASQKTIQTYKRALKQFARWLYINDIDNPIREDIIRYRNELKEKNKPTTVQNYITVVRLFFQWCEQENLYSNVANGVKGSKLDRKHKKDNLNIKQVKKVLTTAKKESVEGLRNYAILLIMFTGGLRTIEISRANIEDIRTVGNNVVLYIQGKGREEKTEYMKILPEVEDAIRNYLKTREPINEQEPLFTSISNNSKGKKLSTRTISGIVKKSFIEAGYNSDRLTAHSTRHTAVTLALLGGQSLQQVQQFARHTNVTTTQIYAHNLDRAKNECESTILKSII